MSAHAVRTDVLQGSGVLFVSSDPAPPKRAPTVTRLDSVKSLDVFDAADFRRRRSTTNRLGFTFKHPSVGEERSAKLSQAPQQSRLFSFAGCATIPLSEVDRAGHRRSRSTDQIDNDRRWQLYWPDRVQRGQLAFQPARQEEHRNGCFRWTASVNAAELLIQQLCRHCNGLNSCSDRRCFATSGVPLSAPPSQNSPDRCTDRAHSADGVPIEPIRQIGEALPPIRGGLEVQHRALSSPAQSADRSLPCRCAKRILSGEDQHA